MSHTQPHSVIATTPRPTRITRHGAPECRGVAYNKRTGTLKHNVAERGENPSVTFVTFARPIRPTDIDILDEAGNMSGEALRGEFDKAIKLPVITRVNYPSITTNIITITTILTPPHIA